MKNVESDRNSFADLAFAFYRAELCRICGKQIGDDDNPIYAGYSKCNSSRTAHEKCWAEKKDDKESWYLSEDE